MDSCRKVLKGGFQSVLAGRTGEHAACTLWIRDSQLGNQCDADSGHRSPLERTD